MVTLDSIETLSKFHSGPRWPLVVCEGSGYVDTEGSITGGLICAPPEPDPAASAYWSNYSDNDSKNTFLCPTH